MIDVIVISYNRPDETQATVESLLEANDDINVILVDNASSERHSLKSNKRLTVINLCKNLGQAGAVNVGLDIAKSEYVCFMHNDLVINDKNWIKKAVDFLKQNDGGLVDVYGYSIIDGAVKRITSLKGHEEQNPIVPEQDFTEVMRTDEMANIFKNDGVRADTRFDMTCCGIWIEQLAKGKKLYVIKLEDATHFRTHSEYKDKKEADRQYWLRKNIRIRKLKEAGIDYII
jgi:glycosyltransferase involved in cell wall biosynthesis